MIRLFIAQTTDGDHVVAAKFSDGTIAPVTMPGSREKAERLMAILARVIGVDRSASAR